MGAPTIFYLTNMTQRKVVGSALADKGIVVLEGDEEERLPTTKRYVDSRGRSYDGSKGVRLGQLPPDVIEFDRSTWGLRIVRGKKDEQPSPDFSEKWYENPAWRKILRRDATRISYEYPSMEPYLDENDEFLWKGVIAGVGEVEVRYDRTKPVGTVRITLLAQPESITAKVDEEVRSRRLTPVQAIDLAITTVHLEGK